MARCFCMAKRTQLAVSRHDPSGQFTKWIGNTKGKDGTPNPRCFYLGMVHICDPLSSVIFLRKAMPSEWRAPICHGIARFSVYRPT
jgi:hypothetical protein